MEKGGGDDSETRSVTEKEGNKKSTTDISASLTPDFRDKEESNNNLCTGEWCCRSWGCGEGCRSDSPPWSWKAHLHSRLHSPLCRVTCRLFLGCTLNAGNKRHNIPVENSRSNNHTAMNQVTVNTVFVAVATITILCNRIHDDYVKVGVQI